MSRLRGSSLSSMTKNRYIDSYDENAPLPGIESIWVWELDIPGSRSLIKVTDVRWNGEEWWIYFRSLLPIHSEINRSDHLCDVGRFWEACTVVRETKTPRPSLDRPRESEE